MDIVSTDCNISVWQTAHSDPFLIYLTNNDIYCKGISPVNSKNDPALCCIVNSVAIQLGNMLLLKNPNDAQLA